MPSLTGQFDRFVGYSPDFLSVAAPTHFGTVSGAVQVSFQRVFSFAGRRDVTRPDVENPSAIPVTLITHAGGGFDVLALGTGLQVARPLRLGFTVNRWLNGYHQTRERKGPRPRTEELDFRLRGWSTNVGLLWSPWDTFNVGLAARTSFSGHVRLRREREDTFPVPSRPNATVTTTNQGEASNLRLDIPGSIGIGVSWRVRSPLTFSLDYTRTAWSDGMIFNYFRVERVVPNADQPEPTTYPELPYPTLDDPEQKDTDQVRIGVEYVVLAGRVKLPIRAGYFTDRQYFSTASGRAPRFNGFTVGTGIGAGPLLFDVAYLYETGTFLDLSGGARTSTDFRRFFVSMIYRRGTAR